jgi:hypothetical protein
MLVRWINSIAPAWMNQPGEAVRVGILVGMIYLCVDWIVCIIEVCKGMQREQLDDMDNYGDSSAGMPPVLAYVMLCVFAVPLIFSVLDLIETFQRVQQ